MNNNKNQLEIIDERIVLGKQFKMYGTIYNPLFLAKDVAEWIEYGISNVSKMVKNVDDDEKIIARTNNTSATFLTEDGLYEVLMQSRKPVAKLFKKEVKSILKQIRTTGGYVKEDREEEFIRNYFPSFSEDVKLAMVQDLKKQNQELKKVVEEQKDKVDYHDRVLNSNRLLNTSDIAKDLGMSAAQLHKKLNERGIIYKRGNTWYPYSKYQHLIPEYMDYHITPYGQQLKWTEKSRAAIIDLLK